MNQTRIDNSIDALAIPNAIVEYNSRILYNSYVVLEGQLSQIDQSQDPEVYVKLNGITQSLFESWVTLGHRSIEGVSMWTP